MKKRYQQILASPRLLICSFICVSVLFFLFGIFLQRISQPDKEEADEEYLTTTTQTKEETPETSSSVAIMYVDIKGGVNKPGIYTFTAEERVYDIVEKAGGVTEHADEKQINFAAKVSDQQVLYIPEIGEELSKVNIIEATTTQESLEEEKININTASLSELQEIPGIGEKKAQEIIHYREANGSFQEIEDLKEISGFGTKTVEKLKNFVTITID
ncbi:hypothetical protein A5844_000242 [Enterococcus sp. 10A9_DIV0425]|uniref:Helix-hairpin-helix DNA-binding motif class 1 domain-containing protein n=1 Tax=Candidatus Enterococcus wittei TaxID=1987383 RepID=A0A2C9XQM0_9ENTE|nr:helix-hairpin-helix domain-containing protein [Enterococcus sp. 10A9_DIV0425]OTP12027.1 hypothetical protein A5844_000242 [Enterococcus sp. 10A9_DIV0425]THE10111.1 comEA protein [Enterococcus hirae]